MFHLEGYLIKEGVWINCEFIPHLFVIPTHSNGSVWSLQSSPKRYLILTNLFFIHFFKKKLLKICSLRNLMYIYEKIVVLRF